MHGKSINQQIVYLQVVNTIHGCSLTVVLRRLFRDLVLGCQSRSSNLITGPNASGLFSDESIPGLVTRSFIHSFIPPIQVRLP